MHIRIYTVCLWFDRLTGYRPERGYDGGDDVCLYPIHFLDLMLWHGTQSVCFMCGALASEQVVLPMLVDEVVAPGWLTNKQFYQGFALVQVGGVSG